MALSAAPASRSLLAVVVAFAIAASAGIGCGLIVGIPTVSEAPSDASADGGSTDGSVSLIDAAPCGRVLPDGALRAGPDMVKIDYALGSYCIDTTEVTVADFNAYLLDAAITISGTAGSTRPGAPGGCDLVGDKCIDDAATSTRPPFVDGMQQDQSLPITNLVWCDAWGYCQWAGKRLCGVIGDGGPTVYASVEETEWGFACINGGLNTPFPYGESYDPTLCNSESGGAVPVKSMPGCHGMVPPFDQIYDMTGNVWEFVNWRDDPDLCGGTDPMGGSWSSGSQASCAGPNGFNACCFAFQQSGFRCCADP
jgi:formylglycine-generating enzyme required for sulfatase activity